MVKRTTKKKSAPISTEIVTKTVEFSAYFAIYGYKWRQSTISYKTISELMNHVLVNNRFPLWGIYGVNKKGHAIKIEGDRKSLVSIGVIETK